MLMKLTFQPDSTKQNGIFKYLIDRFGDKIKNYVEIYGTYKDDTTLFSLINDSYSVRYSSSENNFTDLYISFKNFAVKITHYAMKNLKNFCFSKEWKIYDYTNNVNTLLSTGKFSKCGTGIFCSGNRIQVYQTISNPPIKSLYYKQVGARSDGKKFIEFQSMEIYGTLIFDKAKTCNRNVNHCRMNLFYYYLTLLYS